MTRKQYIVLAVLLTIFLFIPVVFVNLLPTDSAEGESNHSNFLKFAITVVIGQTILLIIFLKNRKKRIS